ncbi:exported hypothetical protein [Cupriavidus taiwanensis]|uniref:Uncharacterized protein n=1 Tax=Cupriavidus taiwanensis TaxID=164546 RepID=A0A375BG61_9BURK|nr:exported hypothetical protein [Cupriavidus taiwanensis]
MPKRRRELLCFSVSRSSSVMVSTSSIGRRESITTSAVISLVIDAIGSTALAFFWNSTSLEFWSITRATLERKARASSVSRRPMASPSEGLDGINAARTGAARCATTTWRLPFFNTTTLRAEPASLLATLAFRALLATGLAALFFSALVVLACFLVDFCVDAALVAASATGTATIDTDTSTAAATADKGVEPKNLEKMESDRNMIRSAHRNGASVGKKEIVSKIKDLQTLLKVRFPYISILRKMYAMHHVCYRTSVRSTQAQSGSPLLPLRSDEANTESPV